MRCAVITHTKSIAFHDSSLLCEYPSIFEYVFVMPTSQMHWPAVTLDSDLTSRKFLSLSACTNLYNIYIISFQIQKANRDLPYGLIMFCSQPKILSFSTKTLVSSASWFKQGHFLLPCHSLYTVYCGILF